ncbi:MAG TPA: replication-associated recombination protein A [Candidatus Blautia gallistercoris]|uniref:Replication-associated recombination protein A n=1 Tax=Candidatus Blautia gallistercoris TaxID=2838490 RepID=A0A9D1WGH7_9FIRM|nr:replication-associated recombination protein A [Candidatus Blautia gallistercoris]
MDLFEYAKSITQEKEAPLASRIRPRTLDEVVGQEHIIGKDKLLYRAIQADKLSSLIFYGPPGTGKTTLAKVIANTTSANFTQMNATVAGKKDMEAVVKQAQTDLGMYGKKTILFIDEIHRFNKGQQDYLLPFVEDGTVILIGATTENPYFEVNGALLSRSIIFELLPLTREDIRRLLIRAVTDEKRGMGSYHPVLDEDALEFLADMAGGDARAALNALELGVLTTPKSPDGKLHLTLEVVSECIQKRVIRYDKGGDNHYDVISAFIKSMRGSDPDAAVYYLAKMLSAGEDVKFIARRIMICAAEDVGNADPMALTTAVSASLAVERVGMPEARIILAQAAAYVACAPKSNSAVMAIDQAMESVRLKKTTVPPHLQDAHYSGHEALGRGIGYRYAHDFPNHYVEQQYLPSEIQGETFYQLSDMGYEKELKAHLNRIKEKKQ